MDSATDLLSKVSGRPLQANERKTVAIELAAFLLEEANRTMTSEEKRLQAQLSRLMDDPVGKAFTTSMTDECFRSSSHRRVAEQMRFLLYKFGVPSYLPFIRRLQLAIFRALPVGLSRFLIPIATYSLRKETSRVILAGEAAPLLKHLQLRKGEGVRQNLNHLGEAILSESEARRRFETYLHDLKHPEIDYISVKISTIFSQINLLDYEGSIEAIAAKLRLLYRAALANRTPGAGKPKFINLDMEEYRDLNLTVAAFKKILDEPEFQSYSAGIVLQAYLPDSHLYQKELTEWAKRRVQQGGAPIKIRIVKGANLAMEQFEASLKGWEQAPYRSKVEVDANYKRMVIYGSVPENARAVHLGIGSHNLFDIAYAMLLRAENKVEPYVCFEMLEGMADHIRRAVQQLTGDILLYCPIATKQEFQHAIAYLIRRLDENTGQENFLRHIFGLKPGSATWQAQVDLFFQSCDLIEKAPIGPRRHQNRLGVPHHLKIDAPFENEPDTDFSLEANRSFIEAVVKKWSHHKEKPLPLLIGGKEIFDNQEGLGVSPNQPTLPLYHYCKAKKEHIELALQTAKANEASWAATSIAHRSHLLAEVAKRLRERRGELIGVMMIDGGKVASESDPEISEAIDMAEYYRRQMEKMGKIKDLAFSPKGTVLVTPPWNFPLAIPAGCILGALMAGNCVLFKPASDTVLVAYHLVRLMHQAGVPPEVLQFIPCSGEGIGSELICDKRVNMVILTGGTSTAQKFLQMRPSLDLTAETGGKNSMIITAVADRDLAIKELIHSAFSHAGQKCSATSLSILEAEVYDDPHFRAHLKEAVASLKVGPSTELASRMNPLIHEPRGELKRALTTLEPGEQWLLAPKVDPENPNLWTPGIKLGVQPGSFTHMTELFGPVLGLMRAENLRHALELANQVPYGLTAGCMSLDERERAYWIENIEAGNLYVNRGTTGAIVRRQPFGGTKCSSFGSGLKAGGPNYLREFLHVKQVAIPQERAPLPPPVNALTSLLDSLPLSVEDLGLYFASVSSYAFFWKKFSEKQDPSQIVGQDNLFFYRPRSRLCLRIGPKSAPLDVVRSLAALLTIGIKAEVSYSGHHPYLAAVASLHFLEESEEQFAERLSEKAFTRVRLLEPASAALQAAAALSATHLADAPVLANGRLELLHYLREVALSIDYHRYGNLGTREGEPRHPIC